MLDLESLFNLSYGMCVACSKSGNKFSGCIVNSVFQITPEPPMLAISINKESLTNNYIAESGVFTVSVLAETVPLELIRKLGFRSSRDINKFEGINYKLASIGAPILMENTVGFIEAEVTTKIEVETHTLFIGKIIACETIDETKIPMTYNYYRDVKGGRTPRTAATYMAKKPEIKSNQGVKKMKKYKCLMCQYIYDPAVGDPDNGAPAGTAFEDLSENWVCPECGASKDEFELVA